MALLRSYFRFFLFVTSTLGLYAIWSIGKFFVPNKTYWRQVIFGAWAQSFVQIAGMRVEIVGPRPKRPFFLVCNHLSYADIPALRAVLEGVFVAKGEIEGWPLAGRIVRDMGTIFIDRQNRRDIPRAGGLIIERLEAGEGVIVFPEGTSTKGETVLPFNSSFLEFAAQTDLPVSYASLTYQTPDGEMPASTAVCWWDETVFLHHLLRLFRVRRFTATITFGEAPIKHANRKLLARELHERIAESFVAVA